MHLVLGPEHINEKKSVLFKARLFSCFVVDLIGAFFSHKLKLSSWWLRKLFLRHALWFSFMSHDAVHFSATNRPMNFITANSARPSGLAKC